MLRLNFNISKDEFEKIINKNYRLALYFMTIIEKKVLNILDFNTFLEFCRDLGYFVVDSNNTIDRNISNNMDDILNKIKYQLDIQKLQKKLDKALISEDTEIGEFGIEIENDNDIILKKDNNIILKIYGDGRNYLFLSYIHKFNLIEGKEGLVLFIKQNQNKINIMKIYDISGLNLLINKFEKMIIVVDSKEKSIKITRDNMEEIFKILSNRILKNELFDEIYFATPIEKK